MTCSRTMKKRFLTHGHVLSLTSGACISFGVVNFKSPPLTCGVEGEREEGRSYTNRPGDGDTPTQAGGGTPQPQPQQGLAPLSLYVEFIWLVMRPRWEDSTVTTSIKMDLILKADDIGSINVSSNVPVPHRCLYSDYFQPLTNRDINL